MIAEVIVDISTAEIDRIFDYAVPDNLKVVVGDRVFVTFGRQHTEGIVVGLKDTTDCPAEKLRPIDGKADEFTAVIPEMVGLMDFLAKKFFLRKADALRLFVPAQMRGGRVRELDRLAGRIATHLPYEEMLGSLRANAANQRALLAYLAANEWEWCAALSEQFGASALNALKERGFVVVEPRKVGRKPYGTLQGSAPKVRLTAEQQAAVEAIMSHDDGFFLLHGVTGSGKTEVYMQCIERVVADGRGAIMLVPEISLTPQTMQRFRGRFGDNVALLHSGLSAGERYDEWLRILRGEARIVVGARSAIFAPMREIGIIIIDEEHDGSYSSESNPRYETVDIAEERARYNQAALILGSATPDLNSYRKAQLGEYQLVRLTKRVNERVMPEMQIVDMCDELRRGNKSILSGALVKAIEETLAKKEQVMIFLNRRGYSSFMICRQCGKVLKCAACDVSLTWHREEKLLKCHYCRNQYAVPTHCPQCGSESIRYGRDGTEKVVADLQKIFPTARLLRMDNDTTRGKTGHLSILTAFASGEADILVGTQMIAKGHDFAHVTLVGILDADMSLYIGDYHSVERTFQLVTQVAGRAGRDELRGRVILQSYSPKHYVFYFAQNYDYEGFYRKEINTREVTEFPPFRKIVRILVTSDTEQAAFDYVKSVLSGVRELMREYPDEISRLQGMRAPISRMENKYRFQVIMRLRPEREEELTAKIHEVAMSRVKGKISVYFEQNPQNMV